MVEGPPRGSGAAAGVHLRGPASVGEGVRDYPGAFEFFEVVSLCVTYFVAPGSSLLSPRGVNRITPG